MPNGGSMPNATSYVTFEGKRLVRVGCMKCNDTIATSSTRPDGTSYLKPWSHYRKFKVMLTDGSFSLLPMCADCIPTITDEDIPHLQRTQRLGWMTEQQAVYKNSPKFKEAVLQAGQFCRSKSISRRA